MKLIPYSPQSFQCGDGAPAVGAYRQAQGIDDDVFRPNAVLCRGLINLLRHPDTALSCLRDTALIQRQRHYNASVLLYQRKYRAHGLFLSVYGVDERLAVVYTHCPLHSHRIRGVQLKRQVDDALQLPNYLLQHGRLIDLRKSYVYIQNMGTVILLGHALS